MATITLREIVRIDEAKCDGCGLCIPSCAEGALEIVDGKARLISETFCDGLGACLGECPQNAITIEVRDSQGFDEEAVELHLTEKKTSTDAPPLQCPSVAPGQFAGRETVGVTNGSLTPVQPALRNWPVQLTLVPPNAPFLQNADLMLAADCAPFAYPGFHQDLLPGHVLLVACPKLDNFEAHMNKLTDIVRHSKLNSLTVVRMEVPCCSGLVYMARQAIDFADGEVPFKEITVGIAGEILS